MSNQCQTNFKPHHINVKLVSSQYQTNAKQNSNQMPKQCQNSAQCQTTSNQCQTNIKTRSNESSYQIHRTSTDLLGYAISEHVAIK